MNAYERRQRDLQYKKRHRDDKRMRLMQTPAPTLGKISRVEREWRELRAGMQTETQWL